jgi:hypothetical protein
MHTDHSHANRRSGNRRSRGATDAELSPEATPQAIAALRRYLELQDQERRIREEKHRIQQQLITHLGSPKSPWTAWTTAVDGHGIQVCCRRDEVYTYNDVVLRERLGARYGTILAPDPRKIRRNLDLVAPLLSTVMNDVGSPDPQRIRHALKQGLLARDDFAGAYRRSVRHRVTVRTARHGERDSDGFARSA